MKKKMVISLVMVFLTVAAITTVAFATESSPAPLLQASDLQLVKDTGADVKATIPLIWAAVIPITLTIWGMVKSVKKGIGMIKGAFVRA